MIILVAGIIVFFAVHLLPSFPILKTSLVKRYGKTRFKITYSLFAACGLTSIIIGMIYAEYIHLWLPPTWSKHFAMTLMLPATILLVSAETSCNIKRFTRHPMLWGVTLWSCAHLSANGDLASLVLFASFGIYSLFDMWSANRRGALKSAKKLPLSNDMKVVVTGVVVYVVILFLHPYFTGRTLVDLTAM